MGRACNSAYGAIIGVGKGRGGDIIAYHFLNRIITGQNVYSRNCVYVTVLDGIFGTLAILSSSHTLA